MFLSSSCSVKVKPVRKKDHRKKRRVRGFLRRQHFVWGLMMLCFLHWPQTAHTAVFSTNEGQTLWPHEKSDLAPDPALDFGCLANGFRYVLLKNPHPRSRVSMHLYVGAGSMNEADDEQGMAHFLEHMLFNGTTHFPPGKLIQYFQSIGMQFGNDVNGRTGFYDTVYDLLLPSGDAMQLDTGLLVFRDYAEKALLLPEEVESERKVVLAEMRDRDSSAYRTFLAGIQFELPGTRVIDRMPIGKERVLRAMTSETLRAFYDRWYEPDNLVLVMVGDFEPSTAKKLIQKHFSPMKRRSASPSLPAFGSFVHKGIKTFYHHEKEEGATTVTIEVARKVKPFNDGFALQKQRILAYLAEQIVQYRIDAMLKDADTPFSDARIGSDFFLNEVFFAQISADCSPEKWRQTLFAIEQVLRQAMTFGFTPAELLRAKKDLLAELESQVKNITTRDSQHLARQIIAAISDNRVFQSPVQEEALYGPVIRTASLESVFTTFNAMWGEQHRLVMVTGNAEPDQAGMSAEAVIAKAFQESMAVGVAPPQKTATRAFPYLPTPENPGKIVRRFNEPQSGTVHVDFENNVRLNLKKTDFKANEILMAAVFDKGRAMEPENLPGLAALAKEVVNESGLGRMDPAALAMALAGKTTKVRFAVGGDQFSFAITTTPEEADLAFELIRAHILDPAIREEAFDLALKRFQEQHDMMFYSIEGAVGLYAQRFFAGGDGRFGFPSSDELAQINRKDIADWVLPAIERAPLEINVAGNFDTAVVIASAARILGTLPRRMMRGQPGIVPGPVFPSGETRKVLVQTKLDKALIIVAYPTDDIWDIHQTRVLSVLAEVFSERVRQQVREKLGVAYSPQVFNQPTRAYKNYGKMMVFVQTAPDAVEQVVAAIKKIAADLVEHGVDAETARYALDPMLTGIKDMKRDNGYWVKTVLKGATKHPQQLEWSRSIVDDYAGITPEELSSAARSFLNNDKAAVFIAVPAP